MYICTYAPCICNSDALIMERMSLYIELYRYNILNLFDWVKFWLTLSRINTKFEKKLKLNH